MAMTKREKTLAAAVGIIVGLFGLQYGVNRVLRTIQSKQDTVDAARAEIDDMQRIETEGLIAGRKLQQLNVKSLPTKQETLVAQYKGWLTQAALDAGVSDIKITPPDRPIKQTSAYSEYKFTLTGECRIDQWIDLLVHYYDTDLLHSIHDLKVTLTKVPGVIKLTLDSHVLALSGASAEQALTGGSSGRLGRSVEEYKRTILERNPFSPPNQAPTLAFERSYELPRGVPWNQILKVEDAEGHEVDLSMVSEQVPEGLELSGKTLSWTPGENGSYEVLVRASDSGWPSATAEERLTFNVVDPPKPEEPAPPPLEFDAAKQAYVSALLSGRSGPEVWIRSRIDGKTHELAEGTDFQIGSIKGKVVGIHLSEDYIELESDGVRWTVGMDTSLAEAFAKGQVD